MCHSPIVDRSSGVPDRFVSQSCCVRFRCVLVRLCPSPVVSQSGCAPVRLCPGPAVSQSRCVPVPLCLSPVVSIATGGFGPLLMNQAKRGHEIESEAGLCMNGKNVERFRRLHRSLHTQAGAAPLWTSVTLVTPPREYPLGMVIVGWRWRWYHAGRCQSCCCLPPPAPPPPPLSPPSYPPAPRAAFMRARRLARAISCLLCRGEKALGN